jgi:hypothetical protein
MLFRKNIHFFWVLFFCTYTYLAQAQVFIQGSYNHQFKNLSALNAIVDDFNTRENHQIKDFKSLGGVHFSVGWYQPVFMVELGFASSIRRQKSFMPNQLRESAEVVVNYLAATAHVGFRPLLNEYLTLGLGVNVGKQRVRYSFGGDYTTPVNVLTVAPEFFVDYAIKLRFLVRKELRNKVFYMLRLRPFYQLHFPTDLVAMEQQFNQNPSANSSAYVQNFSSIGFRIGLVVPVSQVPAETEERIKYRKMSKKERQEKFKLKID